MKKIVLFLLLTCAAIASAPEERFVLRGTEPSFAVHSARRAHHRRPWRTGLSQESSSPADGAARGKQPRHLLRPMGLRRFSGRDFGCHCLYRFFPRRSRVDPESIRPHKSNSRRPLVGGLLAIQYAIAHPEAVEKMILFNSLGASSEEFFLFLQGMVRRMASFCQPKFDAIQSSPKLAAGDPKQSRVSTWLMFRTYCRNPRS